MSFYLRRKKRTPRGEMTSKTEGWSKMELFLFNHML